MTVVFLHGVPETRVVWDGLTQVLGDEGVDSVALMLPGFGCERPAGFAATKDDYVAWLLEVLSGIDAPVDLVGHDWGAGVVLGAVTRPESPVRSWVIDCGSVFHPEFVWHPMAQAWITPGVGEDWMARFVRAEAGAPAEVGSPGWLKTALLESCPDADRARELQAAIDDTMGACILDLYRSATPNIHAGWAEGFSRPTRARGLVVRATADTSDDAAASDEVASMLGARTAELEGLDHWWMMEDPRSVAPVLRGFWDSIAVAR
jgi:pimeloyl-ACP methyl ester carboxylesterase